MKWFKHQSTARNDEKIAHLEDKCGLEGYGFYFKMLELVAEVIDSTDRCEVTYSMSRWGRQTNVTTKKWLFLSSCCADVGLMIVQRCNDDITVNIPNLLKYRDNHTKNLQVTSKQDKEEYKEDKDKEEDIKEKELSGSQTQIDTQGDSLVVHKDEVGPVEAKQPSDKRSAKTIENDLAIADIFDYWKATLNHSRSLLDDKRKKQISDALKIGYSADDLKAAISGCSLTPHNMGENDRNETYDGIHIIFKDAGNIDRFIANSITPPQKSPNSATNRNSGFAKPPQARPIYTLQGNLGAIDSTAEILHEHARL